MTKTDGTKEERGDLGERDAGGHYHYADRYWVYWFDFDGRRYRARLYTDDETDASVMNIGSGRAALTTTTSAQSLPTCERRRGSVPSRRCRRRAGSSR